jgi:hypothetical protein
MMLLETSGQQATPAQLAKEAQDCRRYAVELSDRPEESFLLRLAEAFDELARLQNSRA